MKSLQARLAALSAAHGIPPVGSETPATAATAAAAGGTPMACGTRGGAAASEAAHASGGGGGHQLTMSLQGGLRRFGFKSKALRVTKSTMAAAGPEASVGEEEEEEGGGMEQAEEVQAGGIHTASEGARLLRLRHRGMDVLPATAEEESPNVAAAAAAEDEEEAMHPVAAAAVNDASAAPAPAAAPSRKRRAADSGTPSGSGGVDGRVGAPPCPSSGRGVPPSAAAIVPLSPPVEPGPKRRTPLEVGGADALPDVKRRTPLEPPALGAAAAADNEAVQQQFNGDCATALPAGREAGGDTSTPGPGAPYSLPSSAKSQCADENAPPPPPPSSLPHRQPGPDAAVMSGSRPLVAAEVGVYSNCSSDDAQKPAAAASAPEAPPPRSIPPPPMFDGRPSSKANILPPATAATAASMASKEAVQKQQPVVSGQPAQQQQQQQQPRPSPGTAPAPSSSAPSASAPASGRGPPPERLAEPQRQAMEDQQWVYVHGIRYGGGVRKCGG